jgi:hypothetical protein
VSGLPVSTLLGGKQQDSVLLYRAITQGPPKDMMEMVRKFKQEVKLMLLLVYSLHQKKRHDGEG